MKEPLQEVPDSVMLAVTGEEEESDEPSSKRAKVASVEDVGAPEMAEKTPGLILTDFNGGPE